MTTFVPVVIPLSTVVLLVVLTLTSVTMVVLMTVEALVVVVLPDDICTSHRMPVVKAGQVQWNHSAVELRHFAPGRPSILGSSRQDFRPSQYQPFQQSPRMHSIPVPLAVKSTHVLPLLHGKLLHV